VAQAVSAHRRDRIEEMVVAGNGNDRDSHYRVERLTRCRAPGDATHDVLLRENTNWPAVGIRNDDDAAAGLRHAVHGLPDARGSSDLDGLRPHVIAGNGAK
jgi:hypothetical protein